MVYQFFMCALFPQNTVIFRPFIAIVVVVVAYTVDKYLIYLLFQFY